MYKQVKRYLHITSCPVYNNAYIKYVCYATQQNILLPNVIANRSVVYRLDLVGSHIVVLTCIYMYCILCYLYVLYIMCYCSLTWYAYYIDMYV